jgi:hypothetical protein
VYQAVRLGPLNVRFVRCQSGLAAHLFTSYTRELGYFEEMYEELKEVTSNSVLLITEQRNLTFSSWPLPLDSVCTFYFPNLYTDLHNFTELHTLLACIVTF